MKKYGITELATALTGIDASTPEGMKGAMRKLEERDRAHLQRKLRLIPDARARGRIKNTLERLNIQTEQDLEDLDPVKLTRHPKVGAASMVWLARLGFWSLGTDK